MKESSFNQVMSDLLASTRICISA